MVFYGERQVVESDIQKLVDHIRRNPIKHENTLRKIQCVPLAAMGAVFSINVRPRAWINAVNRFSEYAYGGNKSLEDEETCTSFLRKFNDFKLVAGHTNLHRTAPIGGILKAEAAVLFIRALARERIEGVSDLASDEKVSAAFCRIREISGQRSGISFAFFLMLSGNLNYVKPYRRIRNFVALVLGGHIADPFYSADLVRHAAIRLGVEPANLDLAIFQRMDIKN